MQKRYLKTPDREIHIVSGHVSAGKSTWFKYLSCLPQYQEPRVFKTSTDSVRVHHYANRLSPPAEDNADGHLALYLHLTNWETCVYNDELLYVDTERAILVGQVQTALLDTVVRSRKLHQRKLVAMVERVQEGVYHIEAQTAIKKDLLPPSPPPRVNLRVAMFFCDFEAARRRMLARFKEGTAEATAMLPLAESILPFEVPVDYPFLAINTSDESSEATKRREQEILDFFVAKKAPGDKLLAERAKEARDTIGATKRAMRKWLQSNRLEVHV